MITQRSDSIFDRGYRGSVSSDLDHLHGRHLINISFRQNDVRAPRRTLIFLRNRYKRENGLTTSIAAVNGRMKREHELLGLKYRARV
jgi:hypothetical protein